MHTYWWLMNWLSHNYCSNGDVSMNLIKIRNIFAFPSCCIKWQSPMLISWVLVSAFYTYRVKSIFDNLIDSTIVAYYRKNISNLALTWLSIKRVMHQSMLIVPIWQYVVEVILSFNINGTVPQKSQRWILNLLLEVL